MKTKQTDCIIWWCLLVVIVVVWTCYSCGKKTKEPEKKETYCGCASKASLPVARPLPASTETEPRPGMAIGMNKKMDTEEVPVFFPPSAIPKLVSNPVRPPWRALCRNCN